MPRDFTAQLGRNSDPSANAPGQGCRVAPPAIKTSAAKVKMVWSPGRLHELSRIAAMRSGGAADQRYSIETARPSSSRAHASFWLSVLDRHKSLEHANLGKFPGVPARPTPRRAASDPIRRKRSARGSPRLEESDCPAFVPLRQGCHGDQQNGPQYRPPRHLLSSPWRPRW
jgi:hypothetical protein